MANEDWVKGSEGYWYLTPIGIAKLRKDKREEEKWRREGRAHQIQWVAAIGGVIGTITGLIAVLLK